MQPGLFKPARTLGGIDVVAAVIILSREILVSGLREYLAELRVGLPVTRLAKWKTGFQMCRSGVWVATMPLYGSLVTQMSPSS